MLKSPFGGDDLGSQNIADPVLGSWFDAEPAQNASYKDALKNLSDLKSRVTESMTLPGVALAGVESESTPMAKAPESKPEEKTAYQHLSNILSPDSLSSQWLKDNNLLQKFLADDCHTHMSFAPDGSVNVSLRSVDGYRRTVLCRPDGTSSQRITNPAGEEMVRFGANQQIAKPSGQFAKLPDTRPKQA